MQKNADHVEVLGLEQLLMSYGRFEMIVAGKQQSIGLIAANNVTSKCCTTPKALHCPTYEVSRNFEGNVHSYRFIATFLLQY